MSYCVNCGVELDNSQKICPLCQTPVINPSHPWKEPPAGPYPKQVERLLNKVDYRYGVLLATIALSIPVLCSILIDILITHRISWSLYVTCGAICLFIWLLLPRLIKRPNVYLHILYDEAALQFYLAAIFWLNDAILIYLQLALPLGLAAGTIAYAVTPIIRSKRLQNKLYKPALLIFLLAVLCILIELIVDLNQCGVFSPGWSLVVTVPCLITGLILLQLENKNGLKDRILRRLFM